MGAEAASESILVEEGTMRLLLCGRGMLQLSRHREGPPGEMRQGTRRWKAKWRSEAGYPGHRIREEPKMTNTKGSFPSRRSHTTHMLRVWKEMMKARQKSLKRRWKTWQKQEKMRKVHKMEEPKRTPQKMRRLMMRSLRRSSQQDGRQNRGQQSSGRTEAGRATRREAAGHPTERPWMSERSQRRAPRAECWAIGEGTQNVWTWRMEEINPTGRPMEKTARSQQQYTSHTRSPQQVAESVDTAPA